MANKPCDNLKRLIESKGLKQNYVAKKLGMKVVDFNRLINGKRTFRAEMVIPIAKVLGVTPNEILDADYNEHRVYDQWEN